MVHRIIALAAVWVCWAPLAAATVIPEQLIEQIAERWEGNFDNHRQVEANALRGGRAAPELTRERRDMQVHRLNAPQIGATVLFFEEYRASEPKLANRQRVVSLVFDPKRQQVRAEQLFFKSGATYDRSPIDPAVVIRMGRAEFRHEANCDLYFTLDDAHQRIRGAMLPRVCEYPHEVDGMVYAEFEMLLYADELWYRDRSLRVSDGSIRGEIDGFSWLLFDRQREATVARQQGVWRGTFRRYDDAGKLTAEFPSEIIARVIERDGKRMFHQTNIYSPAGAPQQKIDSFGEIRDGRVWFSNERVEGWSMDIPQDPTGLGAIIYMNYKDGSGLYVYEIIARSADGQRRSRATQFLRSGQIVRRTMIDEEKVTDDWRSYEAARGP